MKAERRRNVSRLLTFLSFLLLIVSTTFFVRIKAQGHTVPLWLMGVTGYAWIFCAFLLINNVARKFSRRKPIQ
ncbi:hypothetical protein CIG75_16390 [Tumebacillus algifaecis]|uniref:Uncharacterized protein n=1 Tax=Tumebacillus algifaecis TaxID=1214604 RepID=A0A223D4B3_9BACL|nr:hypothetical protein [Tumebacillus algifaecis]ASS76375.1 hypothetical protein CIG75_16390 [Tumebacillus algifaecis]